MSVENLCFVIKALIDNENVASGVYEVADEEALSTNELVALAGEAIGKKVAFWKLPKGLVDSIGQVRRCIAAAIEQRAIGEAYRKCGGRRQSSIKGLGYKVFAFAYLRRL